MSPYGAKPQRSLVLESALLTLSDNVDDAVIAALGNAGMAALLALEWRARVQPGDRVVVLGATGAMGSAPVQIAQFLGAERAAGVDLSEERLAGLREKMPQ